jgi:two-component system, response regulator PdtaR
MINLDPRLQAKLRNCLKRVLIIEANQAYARMLADMLRVLGADNIVVETDDRRALALCRTLEPQLVLTEYRAQSVDGIDFTKSLRRSDLACKTAPVIMLKANITPAELGDAKNAGVHEMLAKPFAWQDLTKRLQNVLFKPREWIAVETYTGPDRRSFNAGEYKGKKKRKNEGDQRIAVEEAVRLLKASLEGFDTDAQGTLQTIMTQMAVIVPACKVIKDPRFINAVSAVIQDIRAKAVSKESLGPRVAEMMVCLGLEAQTSSISGPVLLADGQAA